MYKHFRHGKSNNRFTKIKNSETTVGKNAEQWDNSYIMLVGEKNDSSNLNMQFRMLVKLKMRSWNSYHTISHCSFKYIPNKCISDDMYKNIHSSVVCKRK